MHPFDLVGVNLRLMLRMFKQSSVSFLLAASWKKAAPGVAGHHAVTGVGSQSENEVNREQGTLRKREKPSLIILHNSEQIDSPLD